MTDLPKKWISIDGYNKTENIQIMTCSAHRPGANPNGLVEKFNCIFSFEYDVVVVVPASKESGRNIVTIKDIDDKVLKVLDYSSHWGTREWAYVAAKIAIRECVGWLAVTRAARKKKAA